MKSLYLTEYEGQISPSSAKHTSKPKILQFASKKSESSKIVNAYNSQPKQVTAKFHVNFKENSIERQIDFLKNTIINNRKSLHESKKEYSRASSRSKLIACPSLIEKSASIKKALPCKFQPKKQLNSMHMISHLFNDIKTISRAHVTTDIKNELSLFSELNAISKQPIKGQLDTLRREIWIFNNVYDSLSDNEDNNISMTDKYRKWYSIYPYSPFLGVWKILDRWVLRGSLVYYPLVLAFESKYEFHCAIVDFFFFFYCLMSMLIKSVTGVYSKEDILIYDIQTAVKFYENGFFYMDSALLLAYLLLIPLYFVFKEIDVESDGYNLIITYYVLNTFKVLKFFENLSLTTHIEDQTNDMLKPVQETKSSRNDERKKKSDNGDDYNSRILKRIIKIISLLFIVDHIVGCYWISISMREADSNAWLSHYLMLNSSFFEIYITAVYFGMTTILSVGYGDFVPRTTNERWFVMWLLVCGVLFYSTIISTLSEIFKNRSEKEVYLQERISIFNQIKCEYKIPSVLESKINLTLVHGYDNYNKDIVKVLDTLPGSLKNRIYTKMYENKIKNQIFFHGQQVDFILFVVPLLKSTVLNRKDTILAIGQNMEEMFFVYKGQLSLTLGPNYSNFVIRKFNNKYHFGSVLLFTEERCEYEIVVTEKNTELMTLSKMDFKSVKSNFYKALCKIMEYDFIILSSIEKRKERALNYYVENRTFAGFNRTEIEFLNIKLNNYIEYVFSDKVKQRVNNFEEFGENPVFEMIKNIQLPTKASKSKIVHKKSLKLQKQTAITKKKTYDSYKLNGKQITRNASLKSAFSKKYKNDLATKSGKHITYSTYSNAKQTLNETRSSALANIQSQFKDFKEDINNYYTTIYHQTSKFLLKNFHKDTSDLNLINKINTFTKQAYNEVCYVKKNKNNNQPIKLSGFASVLISKKQSIHEDEPSKLSFNSDDFRPCYQKDRLNHKVNEVIYFHSPQLKSKDNTKVSLITINMHNNKTKLKENIESFKSVRFNSPPGLSKKDHQIFSNQQVYSVQNPNISNEKSNISLTENPIANKHTEALIKVDEKHKSNSVLLKNLLFKGVKINRSELKKKEGFIGKILSKIAEKVDQEKQSIEGESTDILLKQVIKGFEKKKTILNNS